MTKAEYIERYGIEWYEEYLERMNHYYKDKYNNDPEFRALHIRMSKESKQKDLNSKGQTKHYIRTRSRCILFKQRQHTILKGYEIHHCFGYEDPSKFIYIPKSLHKAIHSFLRENNINADTDHYKYISAMINECAEYTYISA